MWLWNVAEGKWKDSGLASAGTPGPQGAQGEPGPTGPQGPQGPGGSSIDILNTLDSDRTDAALSAAQGKVLKANIDHLNSDIPKYSITGFDANNEPTGFSIVDGASYTIVRESNGKLQRITSGEKTWTAQYDTQGRFTGLN